MKYYLILTFFLTFLGCRPEQEATEWTTTIKPLIGKNALFSTKMNSAIVVNYEIEKDINSVNLELVVYKKPSNGLLSNCTKTDLTLSCTYTPKANFTGEDLILFKAKDGDFISSETSQILISVLPYSYSDKTREITYISNTNTVCEPLGGNEPVKAKNGLIGNLRLIKEAQELSKVTSLSRRSIQSKLSNYADPLFSDSVEDLKIFMSSVDIPVRDFLDGFSSQEGSVLEYNGEKLVEFFNVNLFADIMVNTDGLADQYEFALGSDDGSKLSIKENNSSEFITYIDSNLEHSTTFLCSENGSGSPRYINLEKDKPVQIEINYFQGPRQKIALQMFWRKKTEAQTMSTSCGRSVNIENLTGEGWKVVPPEVIYLPEGYVNPCADVVKAEMIKEVRFNEKLLENDITTDLIKDIKIFIQDVGTLDLVEYTGEFEIETNQAGSEVEYTFKLSAQDELFRDVDKKIIIQYQKREF
jgi:hypothetical protein